MWEVKPKGDWDSLVKTDQWWTSLSPFSGLSLGGVLVYIKDILIQVWYDLVKKIIFNMN